MPAPDVMMMFRDKRFVREKWLDNDLGSYEEACKIFTMMENAGYFFEEGDYGEEEEGEGRLR